VAPEASEVTLTAYGEKWIAERKLAPRTREIYESIFKLNIAPYLGSLALATIKPATVRTWRTKALADGRPEKQLVKAYRVLRAIMNAAVKEDEILRANPCRLKGFDQAHTPERPVSSISQAFALADLMPARYRALVILAAFSGLRWGELTALQRSDIDLETRTVRVHRKLISVRGKMEFGPPKSEAGVRVVNLPPVALEAVTEHLAEYVGDAADSLLFIGPNGGLLRSCNFRRATKWATSTAKAGLPGRFHFHDLRHLGNMMAASAGASTRELMHRMGQSTMRAALIYQHATSERDREIADAIDRQIRKEMKKPRRPKGKPKP
jgi:integrase